MRELGRGGDRAELVAELELEQEHAGDRDGGAGELVSAVGLAGLGRLGA